MFPKSLDFVNTRPILSLMFVLFFVLFGILSLNGLTFVRLEKKVYPGIAIRTEAQGFDASRIEKEITSPIERIIAQVGGVRKMTSVSEDGSSLIQVQMDEGLDLKFKSLEFREKIDTILSLFPREVHKPQVYRYDPTNSPLMVISFSKDNMNEDELRELVEKSFKKDLESIDGVSQIIVAGGKIRELLIACDAKQLEAYSLSLRDIVNKFQDINQNDSLGKITETGGVLSLQVREKLKQMLQIKELPLRVDALGRIVYLKDIATVSYSPREDHVGARLNAKEKVSAFIYKNDASDAAAISTRVRRILKAKNQLGIVIEFNQDESLILKETIISLFRLAALFVCFLLIFFYFYDRLLPFFLSFCLSLICSLFCLALIYRLFGQSIALSGVYGVLLGSVFWFLFRIREVNLKKSRIRYKQKYKPNLLFGGLIVSLFFSILLSQTVFVFYVSLVTNLILCFIFLDFCFPILYLNVVSHFQYPISSLPIFSQFLKWSSVFLIKKGKEYLDKIKTPILSHKLLLPVSVLFLSLVSIYSILNLDIYDSIQSDEKETVALLEFPSGTAFEHTSKVTLQVEKKLLELTGVEQVVSKIDPAHSLLLITWKEGILPDREFLQALKTGIGSTEDGFLFFASDMDSSYFQEIVFDVLGYDQKELEAITQNLTEKVKNLEGVSEAVLRYKQSREELQLFPKQESFIASSLTLPLFGDELRLALQGGVATKFIDKEREIDVRVRFAEKYRNSKNDFSNIRIKNIKNQFVPISELVTTNEDKIPLKYYHKNRSRVLSFAVKLEGNSSRLRAEVIQFVKNQTLPEGYHIEVEGENETISNQKDNQFFLIYPVVYLLVVTLLFEKQTKLPGMLFGSILPYIFTFFLLQFIFMGPLYLPLQIGMLLSVPLVTYLISHHLERSIYMSLFLSLVYLLLLVFIDTSVLSFLYLWASISLFFLTSSLSIHLKLKWARENEEPIEEFCKGMAKAIVEFLEKKKSRIF